MDNIACENFPEYYYKLEHTIVLVLGLPLPVDATCRSMPHVLGSLLSFAGNLFTWNHPMGNTCHIRFRICMSMCKTYSITEEH